MKTVKNKKYTFHSKTNLHTWIFRKIRCLFTPDGMISWFNLYITMTGKFFTGNYWNFALYYRWCNVSYLSYDNTMWSKNYNSTHVYIALIAEWNRIYKKLAVNNIAVDFLIINKIIVRKVRWVAIHSTYFIFNVLSGTKLTKTCFWWYVINTFVFAICKFQ